MNSPFHFSIESSSVPIYKRIVDCLATNLIEKGHKVTIENPAAQGSLEAHINHLIDNEYDFSLVTNSFTLISSYCLDRDAFAFELVPHGLIFLHHDNCVAKPDFDEEYLVKLFLAYQRVADRSFHFCIESSNCRDLRALGLRNVHKISHASEFNLKPLENHVEWGASFVGHLLDFGKQANIFGSDHRIIRDYWCRVCDLSYPIEPSANEFANRHKLSQPVASLAAKGSYVNQMHNYSFLIRSEVLQRAGDSPISIFGGDPGYLHGHNLSRNIDKVNFTYMPPTNYAGQTAAVYNSSLVNINVTALQFDTCVINRVIDIGAAGGFPLTDWKEDLIELTSVHKEISYRSPEELGDKIEYFTHPDNQKERREICQTLYEEIQASFTYDHVVDYLLSKLVPSDQANAPLKIDLGCGPYKQDGFLGVDKVSNPNVDIVADLTGRFPFATSSVDQLRAHDIIEHLPDRLHTMNEIWRICKHGALVDIRVPSSDGRGAFQDPTHVSFWNANSFYYYSRQFPAYFNLCQAYGFKGEFEMLDIVEESAPDQVIHVNVKLKVIKESELAASVSKPLSSVKLTENQDHNNFDFEIRKINLLLNIDLRQGGFDEHTYSKLKDVVLALLQRRNSNEVNLFVESEQMASDDISAILVQLMFELISANLVGNAQDLPNILAAPPNSALLQQLRSTIFKELTLGDMRISELQAFLDSEE